MKTYVYVANRNELLIDDDGKRVTEARIKEIIGLAGMNVVKISFHPSRSPRNQHVRVVLNKFLSVIERIALQAALGSDPKREVLSLRSVCNVEHPIVLFSHTEWKDKVPSSVCECKEQNKGGTYCSHVRPFTHFYKEYENKDKEE